MQDIGKIIIGIIVFLALLSIPVVVTQASGNAEYVANPQVDMAVVENYIAENFTEPRDNECIESREYMRLNHMHLLNDWRQRVVREGETNHIASDGEEWFMSLTETCMSCHTDRAEFCNQCHYYTATEPECWDCHTELGGG